MIVVRCGGEMDLVDTLELGFPIGLEDDISDFHEKRKQLKPGEGIVLYTDGDPLSICRRNA
jgi:sigma-B regulation protein RsbU (phosphoserine phosphatase)